MKKWIVIAAILICSGLYVMVKFSKPQGQNASNQVEEAHIEGPADVGNNDRVPLAESSSSAVSATQVEAAAEVFGEFQSCLKDQKYEQAWKLTSKFFQSAEYGDFESFKAAMSSDGAAVATLNLHPDSAVKSGELLRFLVTSNDQSVELYVYFIEEDGQWKFHHGQEVRDVDTSIE